MSTNNWQPIETAPRDGTEFIAFIPFKTTHHAMVGSFVPSGKFRSWPGRWEYSPTYWMPLPAMPAAQLQ